MENFAIKNLCAKSLGRNKKEIQISWKWIKSFFRSIRKWINPKLVSCFRKLLDTKRISKWIDQNFPSFTLFPPSKKMFSNWIKMLAFTISTFCSFLNPFFIHVYVGWVNFRPSTSRILELTFLFVYNRIWSCSLTEDLIVNGLMISRPISSLERCTVLFHFMSDRIVIYKNSFSIYLLLSINYRL